MPYKGMNKAILVGEVTDSPKMRTLPTGTAHLTIRLHTLESVPDENGHARERKAWHTVVVWGKQAEAKAKIVTRGKHIAVEGRLVNRSWDDVTGRHYVTEIYATDIVVLEAEKQDAA
jgi:single-strand DNA-binding protein